MVEGQGEGREEGWWRGRGRDGEGWMRGRGERLGGEEGGCAT